MTSVSFSKHSGLSVHPPLVAAMAILAGVSVLTGWAADDPKIKGKPLSTHIKNLENKNRGLQVRAARAISEAPEDVWDAVIPKLLPLLNSERENTRAWAAQALGNYGPKSRAAVKDLIPMLKGTQYERNRTTAAKALGLILKDAKHDEEVEKATVALTSKFNEDYDQYSDVRREAVRALGMIGPAAKSCIPKLTKGLTDFKLHSDEHTMVRQQAAWTCGRMGPLAKEHMDRLISMMHKEGENLPEIVWAIGQIGAIHDNVAPNIVDKLEKVKRPNYVAFTYNAAEALAKFGAKAAPAVDLIRFILKKEGGSTPPKTLVQFFKALQAIGKPAKTALKELEAFKTLENIRMPRGMAQPTQEEMAEVHKTAEEVIKALSAL